MQFIAHHSRFHTQYSSSLIFNFSCFICLETTAVSRLTKTMLNNCLLFHFPGGRGNSRQHSLIPKPDVTLLKIEHFGGSRRRLMLQESSTIRKNKNIRQSNSLLNPSFAHILLPAFYLNCISVCVDNKIPKSNLILINCQHNQSTQQVFLESQHIVTSG